MTRSDSTMQRRSPARGARRRRRAAAAAGAAAPAAPAPGATCSTRRRSAAPLAARTPAQRAGARRQARRRGRPARPRRCYSDDAGKTWQQADVPVSSDLVAVQLPDAPSRLGGRPRRRRPAQRRRRPHLDAPARRPQRSATLLVALLHANAAGDAEVARRGEALRGAGRREPVPRRLVPTTRSNGYVVGAFGLVLRTARRRRDLGAAAARRRQPEGPAPVRGARASAATLYIAGEQGLLLKLDRDGGALRALDTALPGHAVRHRPATTAPSSPTACAATSCAAPTAAAAGSSVATGVSVGLTAGALDERGRIVIVSQAGHVLVSGDDGASFAPLKLERADARRGGRERRRRARS